jgi:hypothetical protein
MSQMILSKENILSEEALVASIRQCEVGGPYQKPNPSPFSLSMIFL